MSPADIADRRSSAPASPAVSPSSGSSRPIRPRAPPPAPLPARIDRLHAPVRARTAAGRMSTVARPQGGALARPVLRPAAVLAVASASSFLVYLDATIVNVAFPDIRASFGGATLAGLSWILSAYAIVFAALLVPGGRLADVVGGRRLFLAGLAAFTAGSLLCATGAVGAAARRRARAAGGGRRDARPVRAAARDGRVPAASSA